MRPLHILLLNEYFPPDTAATAQNASLIAEALAERHRVTVLAGRPSYDPVERHPLYLHRRQVNGNLTIEWVGSTAFARIRMAGRVANYLTYLALSAPRALSLDPDVVVAMTDPPVEGIIGAAISRFLGRPFVYNVRDLYPDFPLAAGLLRPGIWAHRWEEAHRKTLRQASRVIVLGEDMRERIARKGVDRSRISVVRDAVRFSEDLPPADPSVVAEIRNGFRFVIIHAGNLGFYGAWQTLIRIAELLEPAGVGLVFIGEGALKAKIENSARHLPNVKFMPFRPASEIPAVMAAGDLHVVTIKRGFEGVVVPSKMYNILANGRPVLALATQDAEIVPLLRRFGFGSAADPDDAPAAAAAVLEILRSPKRLEEMSRAARSLGKSYDRVIELQKFVRLVEEAAEERSPAMPVTGEV